MSSKSSNIGGAFVAFSLMAAFTAASLKVVAPGEFDYVTDKISNKIGNIFESRKTTSNDYAKLIDKHQLSLGKDVAEQCINIAENANYDNLSINANLYRAKQTNELVCLMKADKNAAPDMQ